MLSILFGETHVIPKTEARFALLFILVVLVALILAACGGSPQPQVIKETVEVIQTVEVLQTVEVVQTVEIQTIVEVDITELSQYRQAPQLAGLVIAQGLPAVDARLPRNPKVITPMDKPGEYGGIWRTTLRGSNDHAWLLRTIGYENLVSWTPDWNDIEPNVAEAWEVNEDATEYTFYLREGMRWSDGQPFTADDILFWYEDIVADEEVPIDAPLYMRVQGEVGSVSKVDDYTVKFTFPKPHGLFLFQLAEPAGRDPVTAPKHYLRQYHSRYNPEAAKQAAELGFESWQTMLANQFVAVHTDTERPVLWGWRLKTGYEEQASLVIAERNPYYWKIDTEGHQLPYIDQLIFDVVETTDQIIARAINGEIDLQDRHIGQPANRDAFEKAASTGNYRLFSTTDDESNTLEIALNLTHPDPERRALYQNKDFRIGLSHAINRQTLINAIFGGQGEASQCAPQPGSKYYNQTLADQYTEFDVDLANEYLDKTGFTARSGGIRAGPDGAPITIVVAVADNQPEQLEMLRLVQRYWEDVGIAMRIETGGRGQLEVLVAANEHDAIARAGAGGSGAAVLLDPISYLPLNSNSAYAPLWARWSIDNERGLEPPATTRQQLSLYQQLQAIAKPEQQDRFMTEILKLAADSFYTICISTPVPGFGIANSALKNVPATMPDSWSYPNPGPTNPTQYYFKLNND